MAGLTIYLFGDFTIRSADGRDISLPRKSQILLAYIASESGTRYERERLAGLLWSNRGDEQARHSLRQRLFTLSKAIGDDGPPPIIANRKWVMLNVEAVDVDVWEFEQLIAQDTPEALRRATDLYSADFLTNPYIDDEELSAWCRTERIRLRDLCYDNLGKLTSYYADTERLDEALETAHRLIILEPLKEDGHRTLMRLLGRAGRRSEAIRQYQDCVELLHRELNVEPEDATRTLYAALRGSGNGDGDPEDEPAQRSNRASQSGRAEGRWRALSRSRVVSAGLGAATAAIVVLLWFALN